MKNHPLKMAAVATLLLCASCAPAKAPKESYDYQGFYSGIKKVVQSDGTYFINDTSQREDEK